MPSSTGSTRRSANRSAGSRTPTARTFTATARRVELNGTPSGAVATLAAKLDLSTIAAAQSSILKQKLAARQVGPLMTHVYGSSEKKALTLSKALLQRNRPERTAK